MEIKVTYSDFERIIKKASIDFGDEQYIDLEFIKEEKEEVCEIPEDGSEETKNRRVTINTGCNEDKETIKLEITAKDENVSLNISNAVDYGELSKIIALLQRMSRQM